MITDEIFELLQKAHETLSRLCEIYTELAETFLSEDDRVNSELFLSKTDEVIKEMLMIRQKTTTTLE